MVVSIVMGSSSDWPTMKKAKDILVKFGVEVRTEVVSAHRTPIKMVEYAQCAKDKGIDVIIAGAGGAAHLPGMIASMTHVPVIGVPIQSKSLSGLDSLYSIVQMPGGVPVATMAIGEAGATNAGLFAAKILSLSNPELYEKLSVYTKELEQKVEDMQDDLK
ncbi:5-(carboxyamino)imidazole ribonucleotide mutase [Phocicoccus pinnipedialis]|uniref:N5-carboxyaminoimidazole ribonucleotide mutase n=1 Tax=Phocicoccus pinnipedialis TaxID=110845 RepID=A0A6V7QZR0_9BACL|nr:5-(carboxyamino)imidazole ribonucleotide mutase [Jeotgalicoccus pinnipedialis]MBP1938711.1 5-(carboxyamino)imidazole ribonucleotide mutase [Jeotgalicoccus pinnipedialis]CAD2070497.1 N5-carboxyaminoimidazole ribonucleotide mutase [Jeotgalicoccus pinnipedialis]